MQNLKSLDHFLFESYLIDQPFTEEQIKESFRILLESSDEMLLEYWYNSVLDFAALIPGIGSFAEGINLVSYAKQGEYLLAGLCAIGLIPIFGQYIGAGGTLLVKALRGGFNIGKGILKPLTGLIARFFPRIVELFKSTKFAEKFSGIGPYIGNMLRSLKDFVMGKNVSSILKNPAAVSGLKSEVKRAKTLTKVGKFVFGGGGQSQNSEKKPTQIPVPSQAYGQYAGKMSNIRPYDDKEIQDAELQKDWATYL